MTIAVDLGRKATKQTNKKQNWFDVLKRVSHWSDVLKRVKSLV